MFTPKLGEDEPNLTIIFFKAVETTNQFFFDVAKKKMGKNLRSKLTKEMAQCDDIFQ